MAVFVSRNMQPCSIDTPTATDLVPATDVLTALNGIRFAFEAGGQIAALLWYSSLDTMYVVGHLS